MKAVGYIRVSTEEQSREGISLEMQAAKIRQYAELNDLTLVEVFEDAGISGKSIKARPGIQAVLAMVKARKVQSVIIYKLDRLARNTIECLEMAQEMDKAGVGLHSISEKLDTQSALGRFFFALTASLAEMERNLISERTTAALAQKRSQGERIGEIPFGYTLGKDKQHLEPDPREQRIAALIQAKKANGASFRAIAKELNERGEVQKKGGCWSHVQVFRIHKATSAESRVSALTHRAVV